jgi:hypothetical protein
MPKKKEEQEEKTIYEYRPQIADAVSWELTYQIMRRYQVLHSLRIYELHPGGGLYDCISLYGKEGHFFDFNLQAQSLHVRNVWRKDDKRFNVVDDYLLAEDPKKYLDKICRQAGLNIPRSLPPANGPVIACGVMAGILRLAMFSRKHYKFLMGFCDTSGYGGGIRTWLLKMFDVTRKAYEKYHKKDERKFYRYFFLEETFSESILCLFDMSGKIILRDDSEIELLPMYDKHKRDITSLSNYVLSLLPD